MDLHPDDTKHHNTTRHDDLKLMKIDGLSLGHNNKFKMTMYNDFDKIYAIFHIIVGMAL
jgi:hypothetical protein